MRRCLSLLVLYLLGNVLLGQEVWDIRIAFKDSDWQTQLITFKQNDRNTRLAADVWINGELYREAGVRYKGNSSFHGSLKLDSEKLPFNIKLDWKHKEQELANGISTLKLSNQFRDPSYIREVLAYKIAEQYMPVAEYGYANLWIGEKYFGFYNFIESIDKPFAKRIFGGKRHVLFKCDPRFDAIQTPGCQKSDYASLQYLGENPQCYDNYYELKSKKGWVELIQLSRTLKEEPKKIEEILDVDALLWWLALNNIMVNIDSYLGIFCHNYYLISDTTGRFHPIIWDLNLAFGGFHVLSKSKALSHDEMARLSPIVHSKENNAKRPLITQILKIEKFRRRYLAHYRTIFQENFLNDRYLELASDIHAQIESFVQDDFRSPYRRDAFRKYLHDSYEQEKKRSIPGITQIMRPRIAYLTKHPLLNRTVPSILNVQDTLHSAGTHKWTCEISGATHVKLYYRRPGEIQYTEISMLPTSGMSWEVTVADEVVAYYVEAIGDAGYAYAPAKASYAPLTVRGAAD